MLLSTLMTAVLVFFQAGVSLGEIYVWTDQEGGEHFSDTPPVGERVKRLKMPVDCPLREEIVALGREDRANLGLWLYLGAPRQTGDASRNGYGGNRDRPKSRWQYEREERASSLRRIKNSIIFEARQCAVGVDKSCLCTQSLFHDPPRGFAPEEYVSPSADEIRAHMSHLAGRNTIQP